MKRTLITLAFLSLLFGLTGCSIKVTKPMLKMMMAGTNKVKAEAAYADSANAQTAALAYVFVKGYFCHNNFQSLSARK